LAHKAIFDSGTIGTGEAWRYVARGRDEIRLGELHQ
jgi:hypothetical protein